MKYVVKGLKVIPNSMITWCIVREWTCLFNIFILFVVTTVLISGTTWSLKISFIKRWFRRYLTWAMCLIEKPSSASEKLIEKPSASEKYIFVQIIFISSFFHKFPFAGILEKFIFCELLHTKCQPIRLPYAFWLSKFGLSN